MYRPQESPICSYFKGVESLKKKVVGIVESSRHEYFLSPRQVQHCCRCSQSYDMGSVSHVDEEKKDLVNDVHRLDRLGVRLKDSPNGGFMVNHNSDSSLVVKVRSKHHIHHALIELM